MNKLDTILNNMQEGKDLDFNKLLFEFAKKLQEDEKEINDNKTNTTCSTVNQQLLGSQSDGSHLPQSKS